jgi:hypothetical protein
MPRVTLSRIDFMHTSLVRSMLLIAAVGGPMLPGVAGCGPPVERVSGRDSGAVLADLKRLEAKLPPERAAAFGKAHRVLLGLTVLEHQDDFAKLQHAIRRQFNGKSVAEILAEYEALDPEVRNQFASGDEGDELPGVAESKD